MDLDEGAVPSPAVGSWAIGSLLARKKGDRKGVGRGREKGKRTGWGKKEDPLETQPLPKQ